MRLSFRFTPTRVRPDGNPCRSCVLGTTCMGIALTVLVGCGQKPSPATVEGTVRRSGNPLDNCLVVFLPEARHGAKAWRFVGLTDAQGHYRLQGEDRREGANLGFYRVTVEDLSVSTGVRRRDHGTVDAQDAPDAEAPPAVRRSRVPDRYGSALQTPLRKEVQPGHQVIDLEIE
jgi:major membrane immunogen (membrane-anchored lipoprotein)